MIIPIFQNGMLYGIPINLNKFGSSDLQLKRDVREPDAKINIIEKNVIPTEQPHRENFRSGGVTTGYEDWLELELLLNVKRTTVHSITRRFQADRSVQHPRGAISDVTRAEEIAIMTLSLSFSLSNDPGEP